MKIVMLFVGLIMGVMPVTGQTNREKEIAKFEKEYQKRIKKERLFGVYIPKDLADSFSQLNRLTSQSSKQAFRNAPEEIAVKKLHFSLGRWIIHNWGFYGGSRLSDYIKEIGVTHPDEQARMIIRSYHRYLNKQPLAIEQQVEQVLAAQKARMEEKMKKATILHTEKRKRVN